MLEFEANIHLKFSLHSFLCNLYADLLHAFLCRLFRNMYSCTGYTSTLYRLHKYTVQATQVSEELTLVPVFHLLYGHEPWKFKGKF